MTDARTTQIALEEWGGSNPAAQLTQIALEQWTSTAVASTQALLTQIGLEQWGKVPVAVTGTQMRVMILA